MNAERRLLNFAQQTHEATPVVLRATDAQTGREHYDVAVRVDGGYSLLEQAIESAVVWAHELGLDRSGPSEPCGACGPDIVVAPAWIYRLGEGALRFDEDPS